VQGIRGRGRWWAGVSFAGDGGRRYLENCKEKNTRQIEESTVKNEGRAIGKRGANRAVAR